MKMKKNIEITTHICKEHNLLMVETRVFSEDNMTMIDARLEIMEIPYVCIEVSDEKLIEKYGMENDVWDFNWEQLSFVKTQMESDKKSDTETKKEGIEIIKRYLELMEHEIIKIDENIVITNDLVEGEKTENSTDYWCEDIIEILEHRLRCNPDMDEDAIEQYTNEIKVLKILGCLE